jgi:hypothetical protein
LRPPRSRLASLAGACALASACSSGHLDLRDPAPDDESYSVVGPTDPNGGVETIVLEWSPYLDQGGAVYTSAAAGETEQQDQELIVPTNGSGTVVRKQSQFDGDRRRCTVITTGRLQPDVCDERMTCTARVDQIEVKDYNGDSRCLDAASAPYEIALADDRLEVDGTTARAATVRLNGAWHPLPDAGAPPFLGKSSAVAIDGGFLVWGEPHEDSGAFAGAIYDIAADAWKPVPVPFPDAPSTPVATAWTERGLAAYSAAGKAAILDPAADQWAPVEATATPPDAGASSAPPAFVSGSGRATFVVAGTAKELFVYGVTYAQSRGAIVGAVFDFVHKTWQRIDTTHGAPVSTAYAEAVPAGRRFIVWSNEAGDTKAAYDVAADAWTPLVVGEANDGIDPLPPELRDASYQSVRVGSDTLVWIQDGGDLNRYTGNELIYDVTRARWGLRSIQPPPPRGRFQPTSGPYGWIFAWGGDALFGTESKMVDSGFAYDIAEGRSILVPATASAPAPRIRAAVAVSGTHMLVWGGCESETRGICVTPRRDGGILPISVPAR